MNCDCRHPKTMHGLEDGCLFKYCPCLRFEEIHLYRSNARTKKKSDPFRGVNYRRSRAFVDDSLDRKFGKAPRFKFHPAHP